MADRADTATLDLPRAVRAGEELDRARLAGWLADTLGSGGELLVEQFPSGHSNLTYLVRQGEHRCWARPST